MAKLGQQIEAQNELQQQSRISRTQRKQAQEQERIAKYRFEQAQKEAERLRTEVFIDKQVQQKYYEYVPREYVDRYGNIVPSWYRMSDRERESILRHTSDRDKVAFERTKTVTDPFTFEEYGQEYEKLSPDIKQFFVSPKEITAEQERKKQEQREILQKRIDVANQRLQNAIAKLQKERDWFNSLEGERRRRNRESFERSEREYEYDIEEYQDQIREAQGKAGMIDQGTTADDIWNYAEDKADYDRRRHESKDRARDEFNKQLKSGNLDADLVKLGLSKEKATYQDYLKKAEDYNKNVAYMQQLQKWSEKVGFANLPSWTQEKLNKSAVDWQRQNPNEVLQFDNKGNVIAVKSKQFGQTLTIDQYQQRIEAYQKVDTSLKLGEKKDTKQYAVMSSGENLKPFTEEQIMLNKAYADKTILQKGWDWVKSNFAGDQTAQTPKLETYKEIKTSPTGEKGTAYITEKFTPESQLYIGELMEFNQKADKLSEKIFTDYEAKLNALPEITQESVNKLKKDEQKMFDEEIAVYGSEFTKDYTKGLEDIKRSRTVENFSVVGLGFLPKTYFKLEDKDRLQAEARKQDQYNFINETKPFVPSGRGTMLYSQRMEIEKAKKLSPTQSEMDAEYLKDFTRYSKAGLPDWMARELAGGEQFGKGVYYGGKVAVIENPRTIGFKTVAFATAVAGATALTTYSGGAGAVASSSIVKWAGVGLTGLWAGSVIVRTSAGSTSYERGMKLGEIGGKEILPILAGGYVGRLVSTKGITYYENWKTMRQKPDYIAPYKRVRMEVLRGEQNFPTAKTSRHMTEFRKAQYSLLTDEKRLLSQGRKVEIYAGSHATTSGRFAKVGKRYVAGAGSSEVPAQYYSSEDSLYFALGKGQKSSLYGGSLFGSAVPKPYVEALRSKGFVKIPRGYKPRMTKAEVVAYLKKFAPEYPLKTIIRSKGSYWKETAFMIERGRTGELIVIGRKSEIEAGKLFGTVAERTAQKPFYTKVSNEAFYRSLQKINRMGRAEFISRVEAFKLKDIISPSSLKLKLMQRFAPAKDDFLLHWTGRSVGSFAPTRRIGRVVPIERYKAIPETQLEREQHFSNIEAIKRSIRGSTTFKQVSAEAIEEQFLTKNIKQVIETDILSSKYRLPKSSLTYAEEYASLISFPKRSYTSPSRSYSRSYSSVKSAISSLLSSDMSRVSSYKSAESSFSSSLTSSPASYDYWSGSSFSTSSKPYKPYYQKIKLPHYDLLKEKIKKRRSVTPEIMGLFPDFTARAVGLAPKELSLKQALREIGKIQTGFEIRTGARIKGFSPIDEKQLLKGVMA